MVSRASMLLLEVMGIGQLVWQLNLKELRERLGQLYFQDAPVSQITGQIQFHSFFCN